MKCNYCNNEIPAGAANCPSCGAAAQQQPQQQPTVQQQAPQQQQVVGVNIKTHLADAIVATLCCFLPTGIVAIIYAAQVNNKIKKGDINGAMESSKNAIMWVWISVGISVILTLMMIPRYL